jgi:probable HAF family extracellular repeat protein
MYDVIQIIEAPNAADIRVTPRGINESDQVTGTIFPNAEDPSRAFLYDGTRTIDLGDFGGGFAQAFAINRCGHIAGWSTGPDGTPQAFRYDGTLRNIGTPGVFSEAFAINDCDKLTGWASFGGQNHAFLYDGVMRDLGTLGGSFSMGKDINNSGVVVGVSTLPGPLPQPLHTFIFDSTTGAGLQDIGTLGGDNTDGNAINNAGQVAGTARTAAGASRAFRYDRGVMQNLGTLDGDDGFSSVGLEINEAGFVIGFDTGFDFVDRGFMHDGVRMHAIAFPGSRSSHVLAINNSGVVVGSSQLPELQGAERAISWAIAGGIVDLNTRLHSPPPGLVLFRALAINDKGSIVALANNGLVLLKVRR